MTANAHTNSSYVPNSPESPGDARRPSRLPCGSPAGRTHRVRPGARCTPVPSSREHSGGEVVVRPVGVDKQIGKQATGRSVGRAATPGAVSSPALGAASTGPSQSLGSFSPTPWPSANAAARPQRVRPAKATALTATPTPLPRHGAPAPERAPLPQSGHHPPAAVRHHGLPAPLTPLPGTSVRPSPDPVPCGSGVPADAVACVVGSARIASPQRPAPGRPGLDQGPRLRSSGDRAPLS